MPLLPSRNLEFQHTVQWSIRNFKFCPSWRKNFFYSPEFNVRLLDLVPLKFFLQTQGGEESMLFGVHPKDDAFKDHGASIDIEVCVQKGKVYRSKDVAFRPRKPPSVPSVCCVVLENVNHSMDLDEGTLVLDVTMKMSVKQEHYWSKIFDLHLVALSNDMVSMVADTLYNNCDTHMKSEKGVNLMAHYCILKARVPSLFKLDTWNSEEKTWDTGLSVEAQRTAKFYLYGRLATPIPENQKKELRKFAELYELKDFESMLKPNPTAFSIGSSLVVEDIGFDLLIADIRWMRTGYRKIAIPLKNIPVQNLEVTYTITSDQSIQFTFEFPNYVEPINMKGSIKLMNRSDEVVREYEICKTLTPEEAWTPPQQFVTKDLVDQLRLRMIVCKLQVTEGEFEPKEVKEDAFEDDYAKRHLLIFNNLKAFGDQLLALYTNQVDCDLELHSGGEVFKVHRTIAVARSPKIGELVIKEAGPRSWWQEAVRDDEALVIRLRDFQPEALKKAILYMYSGRIDPGTPEVMREVVDVADHLQMHLLAEECGQY